MLGNPESWSRMNGFNGHQYEGELPPEVFTEFAGATKVAREPRSIPPIQEAPPPPPTFNFAETPVVTEGPYDYPESELVAHAQPQPAGAAS